MSRISFSHYVKIYSLKAMYLLYKPMYLINMYHWSVVISCHGEKLCLHFLSQLHKLIFTSPSNGLGTNVDAELFLQMCCPKVNLATITRLMHRGGTNRNTCREDYGAIYRGWNKSSLTPEFSLWAADQKLECRRSIWTFWGQHERGGSALSGMKDDRRTWPLFQVQRTRMSFGTSFSKFCSFRHIT